MNVGAATPGSTDVERLRSPWTPSRAEFEELLDGEPRYRIDQLWHGLYTEGVEPTELTTLPKKLRAVLDRQVRPALDLAATRSAEDGGTVKWLWDLGDDVSIETVLMHYPGRSTVCISSQAGCAMRCGFCSTGQGGYQRNLEVGEILEQVVRARAEAAPRRLSNIVFMGMGEPFANYHRVLESIGRLTTDFGIGARHITVSTIGLVPQIRRFAAEGLQVGLAVSLHAANDDKRSELIPINRRHPIETLTEACHEYRSLTGRRVTFEWAMIDGVNDLDDDAHELAAISRAAAAHVNLIPLNPTPGYPTVGTPVDRIKRFRRLLEDLGVNATVRANRGTDIDAACGQLRASTISTAPSTPVAMQPRRPAAGAGGGTDTAG
ncbi:MAG: 23S rRNA (adenine(2503)-C(2))-methyltransferase RlmN [Actinomycetota bacterium]